MLQEDSSEYETDSDDEGGRRLLKPVFVPKVAREVRGVGQGQGQA